MEIYRKIAIKVSEAMASPWTLLFIAAIVGISGWSYRLSVEWQSAMSLSIALLSLLALLFLQRSQSHSDRATHLKLDELIRSIEGPRNDVASIEKESHEKLQTLAEEEPSPEPSPKETDAL